MFSYQLDFMSILFYIADNGLAIIFRYVFCFILYLFLWSFRYRRRRAIEETQRTQAETILKIPIIAIWWRPHNTILRTNIINIVTIIIVLEKWNLWHAIIIVVVIVIVNRAIIIWVRVKLIVVVVLILLLVVIMVMVTSNVTIQWWEDETVIIMLTYQ